MSKTARKHVAISTLGQNNHAVHDERWRYIRYADGSEELYDHDADPHGWNNLAGVTAQTPRITRLRKQIPKTPSPLHPATSGKPHNAWFQAYLRENGIGK